MPVEVKLRSEVSGIVWKVLVSVGDKVNPDESIIAVESMKMEIPVVSERSGRVQSILVAEGQEIAEGDAVAMLLVD